ncbi:MAG: hypothetical protein Unbinned5081contig1002_39 [Prokaryotic dsDNA virus sp.]|nr:MAG: hypothetical protein Unbinned5081contig1002_39 [Prokaryotic dsDNA virus sp.]|tara:strand:+ start:28287 stop:28700 length:414 start_codon:yes stop_codon:yes gene_type:complete
MYSYGNQSKLLLTQARQELQIVFFKAIEIVDIKILQSHRDKETQDEYYRTGRSKVEYPLSKHNRLPSHAIDWAPWPIPESWGERDPKEKARYYYIAGILMAIGNENNIRLRWGGDWDGDTHFNDQTFDDLGHIELIL